MKAINTFTLAQHPGEYEQWPLSTELLLDGQATGQQIPGYVIEAQYAHESFYLLVTSWDCPFEEAQTFVLLSHDLKLLDQKTIGAAYSSVWLQGHAPQGENAVMFHCDGDLDVLATITPKGKLSLSQFERSSGRRLHRSMFEWRNLPLLKFGAVVLILWLCVEGAIMFF